MNIHGRLLIVAVAGLACGGSVLEPVDHAGNWTGSFSLDGQRRHYLAHVPPSIRSGGPVPLVIAFHGTPGTGQTMRVITALDAAADAAGFVVAYPDAAIGEWAAGCDCTPAEQAGVSDTRMVTRLADELASRVAIDRSRLYAVGFSQGALMTCKLACDLAGQLAGAVAVAATMLRPVVEACVPARPLPIVIVHGSEDREFPPDGRVSTATTSVSIAATLATWTGANVCGTTATTDTLPDLADDGTRVLRRTYAGCLEGGEVVYYAIAGGGHTWPGSPADFSPGLGRKSRDISATALVAELVTGER